MVFRILLFGHDTTLLRTRELILSQAGFEVLLATEESEAIRLLAEQPVNLLILCHTLREQERQDVVSAARSSQWSLSVLTLVASTSGYTCNGHDAILSTFDGPHTLVAAVYGLTHTPPLSPQALTVT